MAVTASVQPESDWPDPASCIRFIFLSFKEGIDHSVQNRTGSDLDGLVRCWFNASGLEASWCARNIRPGSGKTTSPLPVSHFQTQLHSSTDGPVHIVQSQPGSSLVLATCIWSGSKLVCKNHQARFWQNATSPLPVFHLQTQLHSSTDGLGYIVQSQPGSSLVPADCVKFWPNGSGLETGRYARITSKY